VRCYASQLSPPNIDHLVQGRDLLERTIVREQATGIMIAVRSGEGFWHDGPIAMREFGWLVG
jgi:hypothetical protein